MIASGRNLATTRFLYMKLRYKHIFQNYLTKNEPAAMAPTY